MKLLLGFATSLALLLLGRCGAPGGTAAMWGARTVLVLGRTSNVDAFELVACLLRHDAPGATTCEDALDGAVGREVRFDSNRTGRVVSVNDATSVTGSTVHAVRITGAGLEDLVATFPAAGTTLRKVAAETTQAEIRNIIRRFIEPRQPLTITSDVIAANLDGDDVDDRILVVSRSDFRANEVHVFVRGQWNLVMGCAFSLQVLGAIDLDGDGRDEVVFRHAGDIAVPRNLGEYSLWHLVNVPRASSSATQAMSWERIGAR